MDYGTLQPERNRIDSLTDSVLAFLERQDRGFCQETDCFLMGEISETKTSLCFCSIHYYQRIGERNFEVIRGAERGL